MRTQESSYPVVLFSLSVAGLAAIVGLLTAALHGFQVFW
jgi:hypothetical protein